MKLLKGKHLRPVPVSSSIQLDSRLVYLGWPGSTSMCPVDKNPMAGSFGVKLRRLFLGISRPIMSNGS